MNFNDFINKAKKFELKEKLRKKFWMVFAAPTFFSILFSSSRGIQIEQFVRDAWNGYPAEDAQVTLIRRPLSGFKDTVRTNVWFGMWATNGSNFIPDLGEGDTLEARIEKDGYTTHSRKIITNASWQIFFDVHIDDPNKDVEAHAPNIATVIDTSNINAPFYGIIWLKKNPAQPCTAVVDTSSGPERYWDYFVNLEKQDSVFDHEDSAYIKLVKESNDTLYYTLIPFRIDTTFGRLQLVADIVYFPLEKEGMPKVKEEKQQKVDLEFKVYPTITKGKVKVSGSKQGEIYNAAGIKVGKYNNSEITIIGPAGIYFLKPKGSNDLFKVVKTR